MESGAQDLLLITTTKAFTNYPTHIAFSSPTHLVSFSNHGLVNIGQLLLKGAHQLPHRGALFQRLEARTIVATAARDRESASTP